MKRGRRWLFTLYVFGREGRAQRAAERIRAIGDGLLGGRYRLTVVDVLERPDLAEAAGVWVTPTLVREAPEPRVHLIGELTDTEQVLRALELGAAQQAPFRLVVLAGGAPPEPRA